MNAEIRYFENLHQFQLNGEGFSYIITEVEGWLLHTYYGTSLPFGDYGYLLRLEENPWTPSANLRDQAVFMDSQSFEFPAFNTGDYREHAVEILESSGCATTDFRYVGYQICNEKPNLPGLPASYQGGQTLVITLKDAKTQVYADLYYTVFDDTPVLARSVKLYNKGTESVKILRCFGLSMDLPEDDYDCITLHGSWARERSAKRVPLHYGKQRFDSCRGESSHQVHPFMALCRKNTTEDMGEALGITQIYSGNFFLQAEVNQHGATRLQMGMNPTDFTWVLNPQEAFYTPECILAYSKEGLGGLSRGFHDFFRQHLIRKQNMPRPVLVNSWEAMYFDLNEEKLLKLGKSAKELGIELLVMDDGWFGHRNSDNSSLGDWYCNTEKLPHGLKGLSDGLKEIGMQFGIWIEPEMVSPDSDLYRSHPEWAIHVEGRPLTLCREQYVLDLSNPQVVEYVWGQIRNMMESADISYVKWDMNRQLTELGSSYLPVEQQRELFHRYTLGVYELMERFVQTYPDVLLENCSGGGARFDAGMLYYSPQIWCSDNTDAISRLSIQYGTSLLYPPSCVGAHVSVCPNHATGRNTLFETRGTVALAGTFGYELDVTALGEAEKNQIPGQIAEHKKYQNLIAEGDLYRLTAPWEGENFYGWGNVSKNKKEALFTFVRVLTLANSKSRLFRLKGLQADKIYVTESGKEYTGSALMEAGIYINFGWGDYTSVKIYLVEKETE